MQTIRTNLRNNASSQYTQFPFTSFCSFNGVILGAGPNGLFRACCGDTDPGATPIAASFKTRRWNLDRIGLKRLRFIYVEFFSGGNLTLTITAGDEQIILLVTAVGEGWQRVRVPVPRIAGKEFFDFEFENTNGGNFVMEAVSGLKVSLAG